MTQTNNFDLIRLVAAIQVAVVHAVTHFGVSGDDHGAIVNVLGFLPGVPIFFFVSGFLISTSYHRSSTLASYARKRALRIFPALWLATTVAVVSVYLSGYFSTVHVDPVEFVVWLLGQATFVQFYNPEFMRGYGTGVLNGALWTITVELQFYVLMPLAAVLLAWSRRTFVAVLLALLAFNALFTAYYLPRYGETFLCKLTYVTWLPWFGMFLLGVLAQEHWPRLQPLVEGKLGFWTLTYLAAATVGMLIESRIGVSISGNRLTVFLFLPLAALVLSAATTAPEFAERLLRGNDLSYGLYIYHIPVINLWLYTGMPETWGGVAACVSLALIMAAASWVLVERPALRFKSARLDESAALMM